MHNMISMHDVVDLGNCVRACAIYAVHNYVFHEILVT